MQCKSGDNANQPSSQINLVFTPEQLELIKLKASSLPSEYDSEIRLSIVCQISAIKEHADAAMPLQQLIVLWEGYASHSNYKKHHNPITQSDLRKL